MHADGTRRLGYLALAAALGWLGWRAFDLWLPAYRAAKEDRARLAALMANASAVPPPPPPWEWSDRGAYPAMDRAIGEARPALEACGSLVVGDVAALELWISAGSSEPVDVTMQSGANLMGGTFECVERAIEALPLRFPESVRVHYILKLETKCDRPWPDCRLPIGP